MLWVAASGACEFCRVRGAVRSDVGGAVCYVLDFDAGREAVVSSFPISIDPNSYTKFFSSGRVPRQCH
jgi:hypothetical protein